MILKIEPYVNDPQNMAGVRALGDTPTFQSNIMTVDMCQAHCAGYSYFGVEFGSQCCKLYPICDEGSVTDIQIVCGNSIHSATTQDTSGNACNEACYGALDTQCGGMSGALTLYAASAAPAPNLPTSYTPASS